MEGTVDEHGGEQRRTGAPRAGEDGNWECRRCRNVNFSHRTNCNRCGETGGNWTCPSCGNLNYAHRSKCNRCEAPRPGGMISPAPGGYGGFVAGPEDLARDFLQCFMHDPNPVQAAISYLSMNANNPLLFQPRDMGMGPMAFRPMFGGAGGPAPFAGNKRPRTGGAPVAGVDGNWLCKSCNNVNLAFRTECNRCKKSKAESESEV